MECGTPATGRSLLFGGALRAVLALALAIAPIVSTAAEVLGRVVGVLDGDTVDLVTADKQQVRVRLSGIDAPEKAQPFSQVSKRALSDLVFDRNVVVVGDKTDRYGRFVGKILVAGADANLQLVAAGLAWHFKRYEHEQPAADRVAYARAEAQARAKSLGLWSQPNRVAPWDYRDAVRTREGRTLPRDLAPVDHP